MYLVLLQNRFKLNDVQYPVSYPSKEIQNWLRIKDMILAYLRLHLSCSIVYEPKIIIKTPSIFNNM